MLYSMVWPYRDESWLNQKFLMVNLKSLLRMLYGRHHDLCSGLWIFLNVPFVFNISSFGRLLWLINEMLNTSGTRTIYRSRTSPFAPSQCFSFLCTVLRILTCIFVLLSKILFIILICIDASRFADWVIRVCDQLLFGGDVNTCKVWRY
jgi:hypothetical protein